MLKFQFGRYSSDAESTVKYRDVLQRQCSGFIFGSLIFSDIFSRWPAFKMGLVYVERSHLINE